MMNNEGPVLEGQVRRLAECPADFLAEPQIGKMGKVKVAAVVSDLLMDLGDPPLTPQLAGHFESDNARKDRNWLCLILIACWLLHDEWYRKRANFGAAALKFLLNEARDLAGMVQAPLFVTDPDRREELVRTCMKALNLRPAGETIEQASDRLNTLDSAERERVIQAAKKAEARTKEILKAMAAEAAQRPADKWTRE